MRVVDVDGLRLVTATVQDADFADDVTKAKFELDAKDGEQLAALIRKIYATPKTIIDKVATLIK